MPCEAPIREQKDRLKQRDNGPQPIRLDESETEIMFCFQICAIYSDRDSRGDGKKEIVIVFEFLIVNDNLSNGPRDRMAK